ncbi:MAG: hypothetical protein AVDCRST_MAG88-2639, partial [uncultured Thermomicrobiales bacterium]
VRAGWAGGSGPGDGDGVENGESVGRARARPSPWGDWRSGRRQPAARVGARSSPVATVAATGQRVSWGGDDSAGRHRLVERQMDEV